MRKFSLYLILFFIAILSSCKSNEEPVVTITTRFGDIKIILFDQTPLHKKNFLKLARSGAFDSTSFHRVIKGFMIQGGDLTSKGMAEPELVPAEINDDLIHERGALSAARMGDDTNPERKSSGSQFYIVDGRKFSEQDLTLDQGQLFQRFGQLVRLEKYQDLYRRMAELERAGHSDEIQKTALQYKDTIEFEFGIELDRTVSPRRLEVYTQKGGAPHLDGAYTVFGMVIHGMEVVDKIASQPTGPMDRPTQEIMMSMKVEEMPKRNITLRYGYSFPE